jgi:DNA primase
LVAPLSLDLIGLHGRRIAGHPRPTWKSAHTTQTWLPGGKDWQGRCPFHEDDTASLVVTPAKNLWHCFGCGIGGGPIDWTMKRQGVSFRHAVELLKADPSLAAAPAASSAVKTSTVRKLAAPVALDADDRTLLGQVIDYYAATLKQSPEALAYLESRGLTGAAAAEAVVTFRLGYANRTLGLRLPAKSRVAGAELRTRLQKVGIYRESGHEHFNGSLVIPILDAAGQVVEVYGRKLRDDLRPGTPLHLYLPGPHAGVWNRAALGSEELIVCEALIDALTFWCAGFRNVTSTYGIEGITDELIEAIHATGVRRVTLDLPPEFVRLCTDDGVEPVGRQPPGYQQRSGRPGRRQRASVCQPHQQHRL